MHPTKVKHVLALVLMLAVTGLAQPSATITARAGNYHNNNNHQPDLPPTCESLQPQSGNRVAFRLYAVGVQIYRWSGTSWTFVEPVATLFADPLYHEKVGTHYLGPTWEGNDGSKVAAARVATCTPDATAIPWLLLQPTSTDGPGIFGSVTYIQRVNTKGGIAPTAPGSSIGALAQVPYSAEYYFYRAKN